MSYRVDTITETQFRCDAGNCQVTFISTWVPKSAALHHVQENGWVTRLNGKISFCPLHTGKAVLSAD